MEIPKHVKTLDYFRTHEYRVFVAPPYFDLDLVHEIKWNRAYIKKLKKHKEKPHLFHKERGYRKDEHYQEWVIESLPFHEKLLSEHTEKYRIITGLIPKKTYRKINKISIRYGGTPEYLIIHKKSKSYFFLATHSNDVRNYWIHLVRDRYKLCDVVVLNDEP